MSHKESIRNDKSIKDTIALTCVCTMSTLQVLKYTAGHINYGGCVTDDWDRRCIMNILNDFYRPEVLSDDHIFSESGIYHQMSTDTSHKVHIITFTYVQFICNGCTCTCTCMYMPDIHVQCTYTGSQINSISICLGIYICIH